MTQEKTTPATVAIIGLGKIGEIVAANLIKGRRPVILADRNLSKAKELAARLGSLTRPMEIPDAIREADIVLLAVWFDAIKELLVKYASGLRGKIIIDPSNPIAPDGKGGFVKTIGAKESAGQQIAELLPKDAKLVKAFSSLGAPSLAGAAFQQPERAVLFYATDDAGVNTTVEALIQDSGFDALRIGGIDQSIRIEVFGDLHQFGALGKTVTLAEVKAKV